MLRSLGVKMKEFGYLCLFPEIYEVMIFSSCRMKDLGGVGRTMAVWVNLGRTFYQIILAFLCEVAHLVDQAAILARDQLISSWSRFPVICIPRSLKRSVSSFRPVWGGVISGLSVAFPKRAYLVIPTIIQTVLLFLTYPSVVGLGGCS